MGLRFWEPLGRYWPFLCTLLLSFALFLSEPTIVDFFHTGHSNWVSLHSLAIAKHSRLAVGGVGFSCTWFDPQGHLWHDYFNRYPLPFAVLSRWILKRWSGDAVSWMYAARQWMNLIFVATGVALWFWLRALRFSRPVAMTALVLTGAAPVVLQYRSMFHFDQPALLAYALLLLVVVRKLLIDRPDLRWYLGMLLVASLAGRSAVVLIFSLVLPSVLTLFRSSSASRWLWCGGPLAFGAVLIATSYNVIWEMRLNQVNLWQTSVVQSALRRLDLSTDGFSPAHLERTSWLGGALPKLIEYLTQYCIPLLTVFALLLLFRLLAGLSSDGLTPRRLQDPGDLVGDSPRLLMLWSTGLSSLLWVVTMKNLFVFHIYAGMMILPFLLLCLASLLERLVVEVGDFWAISDRSLHSILVLSAVSVFLLVLLLGPSAEQRPDQSRKLALEGFFKELNHYRSASETLPPVPKNDGWFPRSPYAQCALLDGPTLLEPPADGIQAPQPPAFPPKPNSR
ncbi:hypothetical protein MITS9509_02262 [Synechococcus sp. MIT S9509]|uniref:hypothetical protein n=1 Tax=unclassified Synechococcus TaxID=2626047 RepID=UPI0007BB08A6|nr:MULTISPECIES: hypothetical protein [unclassified Synechococcus]KZR86119.1 hypothetical protein MITS9504_01525 [Synechococcus sp. MIT S9504]KZR91626.1 hypothetical protein MITS9509_02262 [Synechococcus sp. MIT S9509]